MSKERKMDRFKKQADELGDQLHLKTDQIKDEFEGQKERLKGWVAQKKQELDEMEGETGENYQKVKSGLEHLELQLSLGKADGKEEFLHQKKNIQEGISNVKGSFSHYKHKSGDKWESFKDGIEDETEHFESKMDVVRLHYTLGKAELDEELALRKKQLSNTYSEYKAKFEVGMHDAEDKIKGLWSSFKKKIGDEDEN